MSGHHQGSLVSWVLSAVILVAGNVETGAGIAGGNGKLAFESNRAGGFDLYTVEADGSGIEVLAALVAMDRAPAWSPDGTKVAFQSNLGGDFDIWIVHADGSGLRALTSDPAEEIQPTWSPDGSRIAFARLDAFYGTYDIWDVRSDDGSDPRNLSQDPANDIRPAWSPDGSRIAFESNRDGNSEIYVLEVGAPPASAVNLTRDIFEDTDPDWSPDGARIAFVSDRDVFVPQIWIMTADGSDPHVAPGTLPGDRDPTFSPDGTALAFTRNGPSGHEGIWRVSLDGTASALLDEAPPFTRSADWQSVIPEGENAPPTAFAGPDGNVECAPEEGATVRLDGSGSSDPDSTAGTHDDIVVFEWFLEFGTVHERKIGDGDIVEALLPPGTHSVTLRVTDRGGLWDIDEATWTILEAEPVSMDVTVSPEVLWPPNGRMVPVQASITVSGGECAESVEAILVSVESSEPDDRTGREDGRTAGDIAGAELGTPDYEVFLRAERSGAGPGRTYTLTWSIEGGVGAGPSASATVHVPHDASDRAPRDAVARSGAR